ncbi:MAG: hypothetical protein EOR74_24430 [Mesorhizobium sp.]|nr:MAG: hypothetical protein EOR74_24430 [Mesorhizobium sp.]
MPIPVELNNVDLKFECPRCKHPIVRKGSWFKVIANFRCQNCGENVRLGYPDKLAIFERHKRLAQRL